MRIEILCLLHFCRPDFRTLHISPWSSKDLQVLRICRSKRLDMGLKRVSWVRRYQGQCRALRPLGHQGYRLRNHKKDQPLCSGYTGTPKKIEVVKGQTPLESQDSLMISNNPKITQTAAQSTNHAVNVVHADFRSMAVHVAKQYPIP